MVRWPSPRAVLGCSLAAGSAVAADAYFSAQEGYLARPLDYDGVSYVTSAQSAVMLLHSLHVRAAFHDLITAVSPLWVSVLTAQQLVLGSGAWQAFSARFWAVALLLVLVYWVVSRRSTPWLGAVAVALTALLPLVSPAIRASSVEFITGQSNYVEHWYLDDLRPDFLTGVLVVWAVATIAEHVHTPRRSAYLVSAVFATAAVLAKTSTAPVVLAAWAAALASAWWWNGRSRDATRNTLLAALLLVVLLAPWAVFAHGLSSVVTYLQQVAALRSTYTSSGGLIGGFTYFLARIPIQLGPIEAWAVIAGGLFLTVLLLRRKLGPAEIIYAGLALLFYLAFSLPPSKNPVLGLWISLSIWLFFVAGAARLAMTRWPAFVNRAARVTLSGVAVYVLVVYALGIVALANWPANERRSNAQLLTVTSDVAQELGRHVSAGQCFGYAPGPGWPATLIGILMDGNGNAPVSTAIDVDPSRTAIRDYVAAASGCPAILTYREDIADVAKAFYAPPARQPYLRALADWVHSPDSGFVLDKSWTLSDLPPITPHTLGSYQGQSLTVELYAREQGK